MEKEEEASLKFTKEMLDLINSNWVDADDFEKFAQMAGVAPGEQKVDFTQRFLALLKRLPDKLVSIEKKEKIAEAGHQYLDRVIEEEEELLEEEEEL